MEPLYSAYLRYKYNLAIPNMAPRILHRFQVFSQYTIILEDEILSMKRVGKTSQIQISVAVLFTWTGHAYEVLTDYHHHPRGKG